MGASSGAHFFKTIAGILSSPYALFVFRVKRIFLVKPVLNTMSGILWGVGATEGSGKLAGGLRVEFVANCLANSSALPKEVEIISLLEFKGGKELLQKFWLIFLARVQKDLLPFGQERTLSFIRVLKTCLAVYTVWL
jgi:hypothetical protein